MLQRLIVTGPNGAGKSYLAALLAAARPNVPVVSFDAIKLASNWNRRPQAEIEAELLKVVQGDAWILEGGPSLLLLNMLTVSCGWNLPNGCELGVWAFDHSDA